MKKFLLKLMALTMSMVIMQIQVSAGNNSAAKTSPAEFDEAEIYESFSEVNDLLVFLDENNETSYEDLCNIDSKLILNVSSTAAIALTTQEGQAPPVFSPFLWGCLFSWVGLLIVYLTTDSNKEYTKGAWTGCLINGGCSVLSYVVYIIALVGTYGY
ncbi:MAG: hypothetical protein JXR61_00115 [Prolixibacteraceae bacterium]|nr:hypothetical protein [Prolixibacteraceae bacterium]